MVSHRIPVLGKALSIAFQEGIYEGRYFEQFLDRSRWPEFIVRSYYHARRNLVLWDRSL